MKNHTNVKNLPSPRSGAPVPNQYRIETADGVYFQSYGTTIAHIATDGTVTLDTQAWDYSRTTSKYLHQFLTDERKNAHQSARNNKERYAPYKLADLNA